jgi:hypothetical protein
MDFAAGFLAGALPWFLLGCWAYKQKYDKDFR